MIPKISSCSSRFGRNQSSFFIQYFSARWSNRRYLSYTFSGSTLVLVHGFCCLGLRVCIFRVHSRCDLWCEVLAHLSSGSRSLLQRLCHHLLIGLTIYSVTIIFRYDSDNRRPGVRPLSMFARRRSERQRRLSHQSNVNWTTNPSQDGPGMELSRLGSTSKRDNLSKNLQVIKQETWHSAASASRK